MTVMAKIFISYKRDIDPDTPVATAVYEALRQEHEVFIDTTIQVGEKWAERIQSAIKESDYFISFLSTHSVHSEMVIGEIDTAHQHGKSHGKPSILPIRLGFNEPLVYPLSAYLNPLQWAVWTTDADTPRLIAELKQAVSGGHLLADSAAAVTKPGKTGEQEVPSAFANISLRNLGSPEGTMSDRSPFYIERETDVEATNALHEIQGVTITIKGPRQMGKSSLLNRLLLEGQSKNMRTAFIDFQLIETEAIENPTIFYKQFCSLLSSEFEIEDHTDEAWKSPLGQVQKTTNYLQKHLLKEIQDVQILLAMDEVERMFASPFRSDFFSMLRSWHNNRARGGDWPRLNLALVTSTEPYQFIADLNQSPFNVGQVVELDDFTREQVIELNRRHQNPLTETQLKQLFDLLSGHPYLTRKALYLVASGRDTFAQLLDKACEDNGPFGDHLRNHLFRMGDQEKLKAGLVQIIKYQRCSEEHVFFQLRGSGLVKRVDTKVMTRNKLYTDYFGKRLSG
jgi:hypothetical protein